MDAEATARWFMQAVFGLAVEDSALIAVWTLPDKQTRFFSDCDQAAAYALSRAETADVYVGVGLYRPEIKKGRGKAADVVLTPAMWADIDFGTDHEKPGIAPTLEAATGILERVGIKPSVIVHSGHGLHAYWLLKEATTPADGAAALARRWSATILAVARSQGFEVDSVGDLSRVLRVPGTWNRKGEPLPVMIVSGTDAEPLRYDVDDLEAWCIDPRYDQGNPAAIAHVEPIQVVIGGDPQISNKVLTFIQNDQRFERTFDRRRPDMNNQTPSAYDFSLALQAVVAGFTDQEIADLILAFRDRHGLNIEKARRRSYLQVTIGKAKAAQQHAAAMDELQFMEAEPKEEQLSPSKRTEIITLLSGALRAPVKEWIKHGTEECVFNLILGDGTNIHLGSTRDATEQKAFLRRVYEVTDTMPPPFTALQWTKILNLLGRIVDVVENPEGGRVNLLADWLERYLTRRTVYQEDRWKDALEGYNPFIKDGFLHVNSNNLSSFIDITVERGMTAKKLRPYLWDAGFVNKQITVRLQDGRSLGRRYWAVITKSPIGDFSTEREGQKKW